MSPNPKEQMYGVIGLGQVLGSGQTRQDSMKGYRPGKRTGNLDIAIHIDEMRGDRQDGDDWLWVMQGVSIANESDAVLNCRIWIAGLTKDSGYRQFEAIRRHDGLEDLIASPLRLEPRLHERSSVDGQLAFVQQLTLADDKWRNNPPLIWNGPMELVIKDVRSAREVRIPFPVSVPDQ